MNIFQKIILVQNNDYDVEIIFDDDEILRCIVLVHMLWMGIIVSI